MIAMEERRQKIADMIAVFAIGDEIEFSLWDASKCNGCNGDAIEIAMEGKILSIRGTYAKVENKYGVFNVWLPIAKKL
jgi:hypothetical protein